MGYSLVKMSLVLLKIFLVLALIAGVWNDYPAYEDIPNLQVEGAKNIIQEQMEKNIPQDTKSKANDIKEGMMDKFQKYRDETAHMMDQEVLLKNLGEWKSKILQDVESLWSQVIEQIQHSKERIMMENDDPHYDLTTKLHRLFEKFMPDVFFSKESEMHNDNLASGEKMMVVDVPGCSKDDLVLTISGDKKILLIHGRCTISAADREGALVQREIDEKLRIPSLTNVEKITAGLKNGLLCIIFPAQEPIISDEQISLTINEW